MRDRTEQRKKFETPMLNNISRHDHAEDVRHNKEPMPFFPRKKSDDRSESSKAFQRKWLG